MENLFNLINLIRGKKNKIILSSFRDNSNQPTEFKNVNIQIPTINLSCENERYNDKKILVIGAAKLKEKDIKGIANSMGLNKDRFECCLDYEDAKNYNYRKLQYNPNYSVVMIGAIPHSSKGKGYSSSAITEMEHNEGYPKIVRLGTNQLKITKSDLRTKLKTLKAENWI